MSKNLDDKLFDVRTVDRYLKKGILKKTDVESYLKALPNDEDNFELTVFEEDDMGLSDDAPLSDEEVANLPPISEEDIDKFDFPDKDEN